MHLFFQMVQIKFSGNVLKKIPINKNSTVTSTLKTGPPQAEISPRIKGNYSIDIFNGVK